MTADDPDAEQTGKVIGAPGAEDFAAFWKREYPAVVRLTFVLSGRRDVAEELAQDAFMAAFGHWDRISTYDQPGAWVRRVATNAAVSSLRRRSAEVRALARFGSRRIAAVELPEHDYRLWAAVRALPKRQAQTLALMFIDDLPAAEIARVLGCTEDTVRTHARRGREALARAITTEDVDE